MTNQTPIFNHRRRDQKYGLLHHHATNATLGNDSMYNDNSSYKRVTLPVPDKVVGDHGHGASHAPDQVRGFGAT